MQYVGGVSYFLGVKYLRACPQGTLVEPPVDSGVEKSGNSGKVISVCLTVIKRLIYVVAEVNEIMERGTHVK